MDENDVTRRPDIDVTRRPQAPQDQLMARPAQERGRLRTLPPGTHLQKGGVYVDLNDMEAGPYEALGGEFATSDARLVPKQDVDSLRWNGLVGADDSPALERPGDTWADVGPN